MIKTYLHWEMRHGRPQKSFFLVPLFVHPSEKRAIIIVIHSFPLLLIRKVPFRNSSGSFFLQTGRISQCFFQLFIEMKLTKSSHNFWLNDNIWRCKSFAERETGSTFSRGDSTRMSVTTNFPFSTWLWWPKSIFARASLEQIKFPRTNSFPSFKLNFVGWSNTSISREWEKPFQKILLFSGNESGWFGQCHWGSKLVHFCKKIWWQKILRNWISLRRKFPQGLILLEPSFEICPQTWREVAFIGVGG